MIDFVMETHTMQEMKTKELIEKILNLGLTKYGLAKQVGVSWHCVHAWQKGWYEAGWDNFTKLQIIIDRLNPKQGELFDPVKVHNDEMINKWLNPKKVLATV